MSEKTAQESSETPRPWWWRVLGIRRRQGRYIRIAPTRWGWVLLAGLGLLVAGGGFAEYSMQPDFCRSCHMMEPYYQAWHQSTHKGVPCGDCHFEPGLRNTIKGKWQASAQAVKFITETYGSKPHAEVRDESCLREGCHERRLLEGKVDWKVQTQHGASITIRFDHAPHLGEMRRGKQLRCVSCHSQMVQGQHIVVTLDTCFLCHFKGLEHGRDDQTIGGCRSCHDAPQTALRLATGLFDHDQYVSRGVGCENCHADTIVGDGAVPRQVCWNCHNQPQHLARFGDVRFMHQNHVTDHKVECSSCHVQIVHHLEAAGPAGIKLMTGHGAGGSGAAMADAGSCGQCHQKTHSGALDMYRGVGGRGVPEMPSPMFRAQVDCIACHQFHDKPEEAAAVTGKTFVAAQAACDTCHDQRYSDLLSVWKLTLADHLEETAGKVQEAKSLLSAAVLEGREALELRRLLDDAEHNVRMVELGGGVHNVTYATALLSASAERAAQIKARLSPPDTMKEGP